MSDQSLGMKTAHERWELADFSDRKPAPIAEQSALHTAATMQQLMEVARLREDAKTNGYEEGYTAGYAAGIAEGRTAASDELARIKKIGESLIQSIENATQSTAAEIYSLALDVSKAFIGASLERKPDLILNIINKCVRNLPFNNGLIITVHPNDHATVSKAFEDQIEAKGWLIVDDDSLLPGGCLLDTPKNHIDATIETRWRMLSKEIGSNSEWMIDAN